jgi:hypothetical protein
VGVLKEHQAGATAADLCRRRHQRGDVLHVVGLVNPSGMWLVPLEARLPQSFLWTLPLDLEAVPLRRRQAREGSAHPSHAHPRAATQGRRHANRVQWAASSGLMWTTGEKAMEEEWSTLPEPVLLIE